MNDFEKKNLISGLFYFHCLFEFTETTLHYPNDPGEMHFYGLSAKFANYGYGRIYELFNMAKKCYPKSMELLFWENYVHFILFMSENFPEIDEKFIKQTETKIPFFYFYDVDNDSFVEECQQLYEQVKRGKTCKERYIKSILDAHWKRREFYRKCKH